MPKRGSEKQKQKRSGKGDRKGAPEVARPMANGSGDSDAASEAGSLFSLQSDFPNEDGLGPGVAPPGDAGEIDDISAQEEFENKMREQIDGLAEKSAKARQAALTGIRSGLSKKIAVDFVGDRKMTIADALERCLKKGKGEEQTQAAAVACLLCVQLGIVDDIESLYAPLRSIFLTIMKDQTAALKARSSCADALGLCCFIAGGENENLVSIMDGLLNVFKASFFKGDGSRPNLPPDVTLLHASALSAWALLLTIAPPSWTSTEINNLLPRLQELLESSDVELRIVAGEVIALSYELARMDNEEFDGSDIDGLCEKLRQLATDSNKYRAKKERRQQRSSFRDILRAVGEGDFSEYNVKFGTEVLELDCWCTKRRYDAFCQVLGTGMNQHLIENELVRDIFGLGSPLTADAIKLSRVSKGERQMYQAAAFKVRTLSRGKARDKRMDFG